MGGGQDTSGNTTQTVTNQAPQYIQDQAQHNMGVANYLAAQPFPQYQGQIDAPLNDTQNSGIGQAVQSANSYQPQLQAAGGVTDYALANNPMNNPAINPLNSNYTGQIAANNPLGAQYSLNSPGVIGQYMSPYVQQSLQPQLQAAQLNLANQQNQTNAQATQAGAFGDARQGAENALNNFYGNQTMAGIEGQGLNTAYNSALGAAQSQQQAALNEQGVVQGQQNLAQGQQNLGVNEQQVGLQGGAQLGNLAKQTQQQAVAGANATVDAGNLQQTNAQEQLNTAYQQFLQQSQWPYQMLGLQESAISNNPYSLTNDVQLPQANGTASGLGAFANIAGMAGNLLGGGGSSSSPFG